MRPGMPGLAMFEYGMTLVLLGTTLVPLLVLIFGVIYIVNAVRSWRSVRPEPMLVGQVVMGGLLSVAFQILLVGLTLGIWMIVEGEDLRKVFEASAGWILGGFLSGLYPAYVYFARMHRQSSGNVFRQGLGVNAFFTGLVFTISLTLALSLLINDADHTSLPMITALIYFLANLICAGPLLSEKGDELGPSANEGSPEPIAPS